MAQYAEIADLGRYGLPLAALDGLVPEDIDAQLAQASEIADSYISGRGYTLPLAKWGDDLRGCVCRIAAYEILVHNRGIAAEGEAHAAIEQSRNSAIAWLRDVAKGVANLSEQFTGARSRPAVMQAFVSDTSEDTRGW